MDQSFKCSFLAAMPGSLFARYHEKIPPPILSTCVTLLFSSCGEKPKEISVRSEKTEFKIAWSPYTGWEPLSYMVQSGILKKHADENGITIVVDKVNDYFESINLYSSGDYDAVSITNMDAFAFPAATGIDSTILLPTDFSNGNDAIISKSATSVPELKGKNMKLVELSVSHYLLARALQENGLTQKDVTVTNFSDAQIGSVFTSSDDATVVTWNPIVNSLKTQPKAHILFDSSKIPGEIIDTLLVKTASNPAFKKTLSGAWYETMAAMEKGETKAMEVIANSAGGSLADFKDQLATTEMFYQKSAAKTFIESADLKKSMEFVRSFAYEQGLLGEKKTGKDFIGIEFPDGSVMGDEHNIKLRFTTEFLQ